MQKPSLERGTQQFNTSVMDFYSSIAISITGGALAWIYGLVLIIVVLYTIIALRKQAKNAEDRNKRNPAQNKKLKKK